MAEQPTSELDGNPRTFEATPPSRTYVHAKCGKGTDVSEWDYEALCDPFFNALATMCAHCGAAFPLDEFEWADTRETLSVYRVRLLSHVPAKEVRARRLVGVRLLMYLLLPLAGLILAFALSARRSAPAYMTGAAGGFVVAIIVGKAIPRPTHIDFRRYV
jgi:hypothetical protein